MPRWLEILPTLLALSACAGNTNQANETFTPVPVMEDRALANCTFERLGTVLEERTGMVANAQRELPRILGRKARGMGADAIIEMKMMTIVPVNAGDAGRGRANAMRASAVAIKFTSPTCPTTSNAK